LHWLYATVKRETQSGRNKECEVTSYVKTICSDYPVATVKQEPELILDNWSLPNNKATISATEVKNEAPTPTYNEESEQCILKIEPTIATDLKVYHTVFSITEIKEEAEQIDVQIQPNISKTG
jgi:hypothetical protein